MATHIHSHTGLDLELDSSAKALFTRVLAAVGRGFSAAFAAIRSSREAQVMAEIERFDHRLADEIRAAAQRDQGAR